MRTLALLLAIVLTAGCTRVTIAANNSLNPVMMGPVRSLDVPGAVADNEPASGSFQFTSDFKMMAASGGDGSSSSSRQSTAAGVHDFTVYGLSQGDPAMRMYVDKVHCHGWALYLLFFIATRYHCNTDGGTHTIPRPAPKPGLAPAAATPAVSAPSPTAAPAQATAGQRMMVQAAANRDLPVAIGLIEGALTTGLTLNSQLDADGNTLLMLAAKAGNADLVRHLLSDEVKAKHGPVDLQARNNAGKSAGDLATGAGHADIAAMLGQP